MANVSCARATQGVGELIKTNAKLLLLLLPLYGETDRMDASERQAARASSPRLGWAASVKDLALWQ